MPFSVGLFEDQGCGPFLLVFETAILLGGKCFLMVLTQVSAGKSQSKSLILI